MPNFEITSPDGRVFEVTAPEGATKEQALQRVRAQYAKPTVTAESLRASDPGQYDPNSPEFKARIDPTAGMSGLEKLLAGTASGVANLYRGGRQMFASVADAHGANWAAERGVPYEHENTRRANQAATDARRLDAPLMSTGMGRAGGLLGGVAAAAPLAFIPGVNTYAGAMMTGGLLGALQPVVEGESRLANTALGAAGGTLGKAVGDKAASILLPGKQAAASGSPGVAAAASSVSGSPTAAVRGGGAGFGSVGDDVSAGLNSAQRSALAGGEALGMRTTPGQATGSRALLQMEAKLESQPMTSGPFNKIRSADLLAFFGPLLT